MDRVKIGIVFVFLAASITACGVMDSNESTADQALRCESAAKVTSDLPAEIQPPADSCLMEVTAGTGVQIYTCTAGAWALKAPEADLVQDGKFVGNHYLGPNWQWKDGSKIKGTKVAAVTVDATAIPWLLLSAAAVQPGFTGRLSKVTSVVRRDTRGGLAPTAVPCTEGAEERIPYSANYLFLSHK